MRIVCIEGYWVNPAMIQYVVKSYMNGYGAKLVFGPDHSIHLRSTMENVIHLLRGE